MHGCRRGHASGQWGEPPLRSGCAIREADAPSPDARAAACPARLRASGSRRRGSWEHLAMRPMPNRLGAEPRVDLTVWSGRGSRGGAAVLRESPVSALPVHTLQPSAVRVASCPLHRRSVRCGGRCPRCDCLGLILNAVPPLLTAAITEPEPAAAGPQPVHLKGYSVCGLAALTCAPDGRRVRVSLPVPSAGWSGAPPVRSWIAGESLRRGTSNYPPSQCPLVGRDHSVPDWGNTVLVPAIRRRRSRFACASATDPNVIRDATKSEPPPVGNSMVHRWSMVILSGSGA